MLCRSRQAFRTKPSIIVGRKGSAGEVNLTEGPFWPTDVTYFVKHDERASDLRYLFYALKLLSLQKLAKGVKPGINRNDVYALKMPMPSLHEQKRIVAILDEAFEGIDTAVTNAEKNLANARDLLSEVHSKEFQTLSISSKIVTLGSICSFENGDRGKNYPGKEHRVASGVAFINAGHLTGGGIDHASMDFISQERFDLLRNGKIKPKDVLFCLRGSIGKFSSVEELAAGAIASSLVILRPKASLIHDYLLEYLASDLCREMIEKFKGGAAQPNLGAKDLGKFALPLPSLTEQERVSRRLRQIRVETKRLDATYLRKLLALNSLKQAILRKAFAGELTAQPENILPEAAE